MYFIVVPPTPYSGEYFKYFTTPEYESLLTCSVSNPYENHRDVGRKPPPGAAGTGGSRSTFYRRIVSYHLKIRNQEGKRLRDQQ